MDKPAPILDGEFTLRRFILNFLVRLAWGLLKIWALMQLIGMTFYALYHYTDIAFSEFMFRGFINYWATWGEHIKYELTPWWLRWIWQLPTWQTPFVWVLALIVPTLAILIYFRHSPLPKMPKRKKPKRKAKRPPPVKDGEAEIEENGDDWGYDPKAFENSKPEPRAKNKEQLNEARARIERMRKTNDRKRIR